MLLRNFLRNLPSFQYLSEADVDHIAAAMRVDDYPDQHVFIYQERLNKELFLLLDGTVKVCHYGNGGRYYTLKTLKPGEFFGIPSISQGIASLTSCQSSGPVKVASLPFSAYMLLYQPGSDIGCRFQYVIASQLARDLHDRHDALRNLLVQVYGSRSE
ncbi:MAG: cyclic nucleotide-binding domain-containing protein [Gammaproteobacteria bacterium]|nr:cyclic nucleotide-binding domain-containing protein [Gammaproteobacteria bacterium]